MKTVTGTISIDLEGARFGPPKPPHTYFGVAQAMLNGLRLLATDAGRCAVPFSMVGAHMLECLLKAFLSRSGDDKRLKDNKLKHNLNALWALAHAEGLKVPEQAPHWVSELSHVHDAPYHLRYSERVHGVVLPGPEPMTTDLGHLLELVRKSITQ